MSVMMEVLASAWATAVWWAAVIFFVGLILGIATLAMGLIALIIESFLDAWAKRHVDKE